MKRLTGLLLAGFGLATAGMMMQTAPGLSAERTVRGVVELFTSQGCSSCPPADALMQKLSADPTLVTLSFPVDYWDYLGWKDTFAKPEYSARQRDYASLRGDREVYTPQAVIDGRLHEIGSDSDGIARSISAQSGATGLPIRVNVEMAGDTVIARIGDTADANQTKATVWLVKFSHRETIDIGRGENSGRTVTYTNVVKEMQPVGLWKGQAMTIELPRNAITKGKNCGFALLLQTDVEGKPGPIIGATMLNDGSAS